MANDASLIMMENIPFLLKETELLRLLHLDDSFAFLDDILRLAREAEALARPKGFYVLSAVEHTGDDTVTLNDIIFTSRVLRVNLDGVYRAFPFLATCGGELELWTRSLDDPMQSFCGDALKEMALRQAIEALGAHLMGTYDTGELAMMNPGSLSDWPITEQKPLFSLFGDAAEAIGVTLSESCLMSPIKSVSGVWFPTQKGFVNCRLCRRENCPNRRTPYDSHLFESHYQ
ncbi:MAG TPA: vitamin B12 dependent methionine synthase [Candidatus Hydrogenedentes bacterium]|nr:vitamin B12 dependent methionine synthase [Candidatus Hydrogenedentota bacterium]